MKRIFVLQYCFNFTEYINIYNISIPVQLNKMFSMDFAYNSTALFIEPPTFSTHGSCLSGFFSRPTFSPPLLEISLKQVIKMTTIWGYFLRARHYNKFIAYIIALILTIQRSRNYYVHFRELGSREINSLDYDHVWKVVIQLNIQLE